MLSFRFIQVGEIATMKYKYLPFHLTTIATLFVVTCAGLGCTKYQAVAVSKPEARVTDSKVEPCQSSQLTDEVKKIASVTNGPVGASFLNIESGASASFEGERYFPTQSVYKFPIAILVLRQVDAGKLSLDQR